VDDSDRGIDLEPVDPVRTALLGLCTALLAIAFLSLLIVDQASAVTF
jgi:hypothetical protein